MRQSCKVQGLPPGIPPVVEEIQKYAMDQPPMANSHVEGVPIAESRENISSFSKSIIIEQPSTNDTSFHFWAKGKPNPYDWLVSHPPDDIVAVEFGPNVPFWETSLGHAISEYGTIRPS